MTSDRRPGELAATEVVTERTRVSAVEVFFDLVYVFAITHVTVLVASGSEVGAVRGGLVVAVIWRVWIGYAWLSNGVLVERRTMQITMLSAIAVLFLVGAAIPEAFVDKPGGFNAPLVFVGCYLAARLLHARVIWSTSDREDRVRRSLRVVAPAIGASALLACAAVVPRRLLDDRFWISFAQDGLWLLAIAVEYGVGFVVIRRWPVLSARLWNERHQLIIMVALGEAFVGLGLGGTAIPLSGPLIVASILGLVITTALWWAYFEVLSPMGELALRRLSGTARAVLARDAYSFLHLPILVGIILFSLGLRKVLGFLEHLDAHGMGAALDGVSLGSLYGGVILFLLGVVAFELRLTRHVNRLRVGATVLLAALAPIGSLVPASAAFGMLTAVAIGLVAVEFMPHTARHRELREALSAEEG